MAGYSGYSMSNNAVIARNNGLYPKTDCIKALAKEVGCTQKVARVIVEKMDPSEWHHTSSKYNRTDFYCLESAVEAYKKRPTLPAFDVWFAEYLLTVEEKYRAAEATHREYWLGQYKRFTGK